MSYQHYMTHLVMQLLYNKLTSASVPTPGPPTAQSVDDFWQALLRQYFRLDLGFASLGQRRLRREPEQQQEQHRGQNDRRYRVHEIHNFDSQRTVTVIEDQEVLRDVRREDWEAGREYLGAYMRALREEQKEEVEQGQEEEVERKEPKSGGGGGDGAGDLYGLVCIGVYLRIYVLEEGKEGCEDFETGEDVVDRVLEGARDEVAIHDVLTRLARVTSVDEGTQVLRSNNDAEAGGEPS